MGIQVEFNPDLALRNFTAFSSSNGSRLEEECIPEKLEEGHSYKFLKKGQRNYWLEGEIPLVETEGFGILSRPVASVIVKEATHFIHFVTKEVWTKGIYEVVEVYNSEDKTIHFEGFTKLGLKTKLK